MIVEDSEEILRQAVSGGATVNSPIGEGHGWRGRIIDPFGHVGNREASRNLATIDCAVSVADPPADASWWLAVV